MSAGVLIIASLLGVAALTLFFWYIPREARAHGVVRRFERSTAYGWQEFAEVWRPTADKYVSPILFPLDLIMMACWAAALALATVTLGRRVPSLAHDLAWLAALPALYFVADLVEDLLLGRFLKVAHAATPGWVAVLKIVTRTKVASLLAAHVVLLCVAVLACLKTY